MTDKPANLRRLHNASMAVHCERNGIGVTMLIADYQIDGKLYNSAHRLPYAPTVAEVEAQIQKWAAYFVGKACE